MKSALRIHLSVSYGMIGILLISRYAAPPYPAAPDFPPSGGTEQPVLKVESLQKIASRSFIVPPV